MRLLNRSGRLTNTNGIRLPRNFDEAVKRFANQDVSRNFLAARRWPKGIACPVCGSTSVYEDPSRQGWECKTRHPKRRFTLKTGTIFEDSALPIGKWLAAIWLVGNNKPMPIDELARRIGVTQKTAWLMLRRIRLAMRNDQGS